MITKSSANRLIENYLRDSLLSREEAIATNQSDPHNILTGAEMQSQLIIVFNRRR
ncbi:MAG: hypothetical protein BWX60_01101 [Candidatus Marinimicrobia bacterium ADurb.Bin030]|nr:MAG: hypothetical protein BWX60_01101 [Candidatus Marinimicrobia bacterium ADurb.Bin030]